MKKLQRYHISAGSFYVGGKSPMILKAYLGTCVGIALYDDQVGVGGLIHLLLPEPVSQNILDTPEKYASTGLPIFLKALYDLGAVRENLKACIAGGALVGPINEQDLALDIGGRTAETALKILKNENIPVTFSETGGFFSCCLSLDMDRLKPEIKPGVSEIDSSAAEIPNQPNAEAIDQTIKKLQPIPQITLKVLRIINEDTYNIAEIAEEIRMDQVISARVLKFCNSVMFPTITRIESLDEALILMGQEFLVRSILMVTVDQLFKTSSMGYSLCKGGLFYHALGTAVTAEKIALITGKIPPPIAYTAGLLHDIGKVVLDQHVAASHPMFYRSLAETSDILKAEHRTLGTTHTEAGQRLALKWNFPDSLVESIQYHHHPEHSHTQRILTHIVYLADLLMSRFNSGLELECICTKGLSSRLGAIGISFSEFESVVDQIPGAALQTIPSLNCRKIKGTGFDTTNGKHTMN